MTILAAADLRIQRDGREIVHVPHLSVERGATLGLIGPNGAGKSTLLLTLALLHPHASGELVFDGVPILPRTNRVALRRRAAVVFQAPLLLDRSVADNVGLGLRLRGESRSTVAPRVAAWLERFGIAHLAQRSARALSGGEAQRANLARAFVLEPRLLFLDEPFAGLDLPTRAEVVASLSQVLRATGVTAILVSHDRDEVAALAQRVGVVLDGQVRQIGCVDDVFHHPVDSRVAQLVGMESLGTGTVIDRRDGSTRVDLGAWQVTVAGALPVASRVTVLYRPEDLVLVTGASSPCTNILTGPVTQILPWHGRLRLLVGAQAPVVVSISRREFLERGLAHGSPVAVHLPSALTHAVSA